MLRGAWENFWLRTVIVALIAIMVSIMPTLLVIATVYARGYGVVGDFAGVYAASLEPIPLMCLPLCWILAEIAFKKGGRAPYLGSYLLFIVTFGGVIDLGPAEVVTFTSPTGAIIFKSVEAVVAGALAFVPAWLYARFTRPKSDNRVDLDVF